MTNSNDRLDPIVALVEANRTDINELRKLIESNAKAIQANSNQIAEVDRTLAAAIDRALGAVDDRTDINELRKLIESNAKAIQANSNQIAEVDRTLAAAIGRTLGAVDELRERAEEDRVNFQEHVEHTDTAIAGINATLAAVNTSIANQGRILDNQGRILDYLIRRDDRDGNDDQS